MSTGDNWPGTRVSAYEPDAVSTVSRPRFQIGEAGRTALAFLAGGICAVIVIVLLGLGSRNNPVAVGNPASTGSETPAAAQEAGAGAADEARPAGLPVTRDDWVVTKDYAAHGGLKPHPANNQGAIDIGFWHNKDAIGADVIATHSGTVKLLRADPTYGNLVYVLGARWNTTYGHLLDFTVKEGDKVQRGQVIGHMGSTGASSGPHVDYQVWENGVNLNPMDFCGCSAMQGPGAKD